MAKRTDMGKKFVKRSGKGFDQIKDLKISNDALLILKKNNNSKEQIEKLKKKINILRLGGSVSGICLDYYLSAKTRLNFELGGMATHFEEFFRTRTILFDISKRYFGTAAEKMDYLIFYGYNLSLMGDSKIKADKMVKFFKEKIHEKFKTLKKEQAIKKIKELYQYEEVSFLGLTYGSFDFGNTNLRADIKKQRITRKNGKTIIEYDYNVYMYDYFEKPLGDTKPDFGRRYIMRTTPVPRTGKVII